MTEESSADSQLRVSAAMAESNTTQQNIDRNASRAKGASETDVLMMDDVQFSASLDRLLDSELVHSAYNSASAPRTVSTDPSVASSASSVAAARIPQQTAAMPSSSFPVTGGGLPPPPQRPLKNPGANVPVNTLLPPPPKNPAMLGPSPLTQRLAFTMPMTLPPASVRSSIPMTGAEHTFAGQKRGRASLPVSEDEGDREKRRQDRNLREQQRSRRITEQITLLRDVLMEAGVPCKPDKNSTLIGVAEYIQQLQNRASLLDQEHKKLLDTIARTNEMVNNQYYQATADGSSIATGASPAPVSNDLLSDANMVSGPLEDENAVFVQGLDYKSVFTRCGIALAVASIDGRFIDCNSEFVALSGYSRKELLPGEELSKTEIRPEAVPSKSVDKPLDSPERNLSLFNLLNREDMETVFTAMSGMIRRSEPPADPSSTQQDYWSGYVRQNREDDTSVSSLYHLVTLNRFDCFYSHFPSLFEISATSHEHYTSPNTGWTPQVLQLLLDDRRLSFGLG